MRDYIAGFSCRDIAKNYFSKEIWDAHEAGIIHIHDTDYSPAMPMYNCCLINLEDMLQNGTVISKTMIEKPKSFRTACTVTTQIITQVASSQYGGNTINLAHLAPFVDISRQKIREKVKNEIIETEGNLDKIDEITEKQVLEEIKDGIQTIQYQLITMSTTNG
jgi:ribonucleoside-triphosphate reductase